MEVIIPDNIVDPDVIFMYVTGSNNGFDPMASINRYDSNREWEEYTTYL